jgi:hypothetical protein
VTDGSPVLDTTVPHSARVWNYWHYNENSASTYHPRSPERITSFFAGLDLVEPGVVELSRWRPDGTSGPGPAEVPGVGGVARKP